MDHSCSGSLLFGFKSNICYFYCEFYWYVLHALFSITTLIDLIEALVKYIGHCTELYIIMVPFFSTTQLDSIYTQLLTRTKLFLDKTDIEKVRRCHRFTQIYIQPSTKIRTSFVRWNTKQYTFSWAIWKPEKWLYPLKSQCGIPKTQKWTLRLNLHVTTAK